MQKILKYLGFAFAVLFFWLFVVVVSIYRQVDVQGEVRWHSCQRLAYWSWFVLEKPPAKLQCATIQVPVDYANPDGKQFTLALTRLPSKNPNPIGDLLLLDGGPGANSLQMPFMMLGGEYADKVKDNFHLIGYTPRGIAPSSPVIDCGGLDEVEGAKDYLDACTQKIGADVLPFIGSKEVVKDLDSIRTRLGVETWSMVGYSYGTKLVSQYAKHYPTRLRAGVADGVVDTTEDLFTMLTNQYHNAQLAFEGFMTFCLAEVSCVFDGDKEPSVAFLETLHDIEAKNLTDQDGDKISAKSMLKIFDENVNYQVFWYDMVMMFDELNQGKTNLYDAQKRLSEFAQKGFNNDALILVNCADSAPKLSKEDYIKHAKHVDKQAHYDDIMPIRDEEYLDTCFYWQYQAGDNLAENLVNERTPNLLFVSHEHDLATPFANAKTMAERFDDPLIVVPYHGHTVSLFGTNLCVDDHVVRYLTDPKTDFGEKVMYCEW
ncbi:alpha/beta fold hydrolase [Moraxella oblonga]|uniref:alpha/beta fold hydrolase n=1 Tax=Moraxella oblonga TaxID=200413 RepID=UPI00082D041B|nr:alpha/beta fold hydrolase [Moraxella oblonga]